MGTLEPGSSNAISFPVAVSLTTSESLSELPLEKRCLTAEVVSAVPWFASDISKRENDVAIMCLGKEPALLLDEGEITLFDFYPCVGVTSAPCTSDNTLELVVVGESLGAGRIVQPDELFLHNADWRFRGTKSKPTWSTSRSFDLTDSQKRLSDSLWSAAREDVTVTGPGGGQLPGSFTIDFKNNLIPDFAITDTTKATGVSFDEVGFDAEFSILFGSLGTYILTFDIRATHSTAGVLTDRGTYTFHVGPVADLEVRDAGASREVATGQQAYSIQAVNNGPDEAPTVQITGLPTGVTEYVASEGSYDPNNGVWTIGRLRIGDAYRGSGHAYEAPTLTLITADAAGTGITAAIETTQDYCVRIKTGATGAGNDLPCTGDLPTGYTQHSAAYYDHIQRNNSAIITARVGIGAFPGKTQGLKVLATPVGNVVQWDPLADLNGFDVTHYQVQRSASPWTTLNDDVKGTVYADLGDGAAGASYRVRAVNIFGVPGPWSEPSSRRPGAPKDFTATVDVSNAEIGLSWGRPDAVDGITRTGYGLEFSTDGGANWTALANQAAAATTFAHTGRTLTPGATWLYRLRTLGDESGVAVMSDWAEARAAIPYPVPVNFTATGVSDTKATLSWSAPAGVTPSGFNLQFTKDGGDRWTDLPDQAATATGYTHTDNTLTADDVREYRIRTTGTVGSVSVTSDWVRRAAAKDYPEPDPPGNFTAEGVSNATANLSWDAPTDLDSTTISGYELEYSTDGGADWTSLADDRTGTTFTTAMRYTHTDNDLGAGDVRQYRARTVATKDGETFRSVWAYALASTDYPAPGAPKGFTARAISQARVDLSWSAPDAVAGVTHTGYDLDWSPDGNDWTSLLQDDSATSHEHEDETLAAGIIRQYRVRAVGTTGSGNTLATFRSGWVFASATTEEVGPPRNLAAGADGKTRIDLRWDEPAFGAELVAGYRIDYALADTGAWQTLEHAWRTIPRTYEHTGLSPGHEYCYRVAATHAGGTGPFTARACATTEGAPTDLPGEPENLRIAQVGSNYVTLDWDPPSVGGEAEYYEYRSNNGQAVRVTPGTATSVRVGNLAPQASYGFQVRAGNSYGPGKWSPEVYVTLHRAAGTLVASPLDLNLDKGGSGSFNVRLKSSPEWPMFVHLFFEGPACLTEALDYQQFKILLPGNPPPSKEFWEDVNWVPEPGDKYRFVQAWNAGLNYLVDASGCRGGETAVVNYDVTTIPFSYLEDASTWDFLDLDKEEWREKWGVDPLDGSSGPSVKVTVEDGGTVNQQSGDPGGGAGLPTAVALALGQTSVSEKAGQVTVTATLDAPAPPGGVTVALYLDPEASSTAERDADYALPDTIAIPAGQYSGTALLSIVDDAVDEEDETVNLAVIVLSDVIYDYLTAAAVLTITDDDTAGVTVSAASGLAVDEGETATYTVVLGSQPTADVTITPFSGDGAKVSVSPASHTFTPWGWNTPLTFTASGVDDDDANDESVEIRHWIDSDDWRYALVPLSTVPVAVSDTTPEQQGPPNQAPTVASAIADATIVNESGTQTVSLSGVFSDADNDSLTITAGSDNEGAATASVSSDGSTLTVGAHSRGTATITVTADDGNGGKVSDSFSITVKAAPTVAQALADVSGLEADATQDIALAGVFRDADGDDLTITAVSSDDAVATVAVASDGSSLTVTAKSRGTATITVTARDSDGNTVSDVFEVSVVQAPEPEDDPPADGETSGGAPTVVSPLSDVSLEGGEYRELSLSGVFTGPDGDDLSFTVASSNYPVATGWVDGLTLTVVATGTGTAIITVTAEDPDGNKVGAAFEVTVRPSS